MVIPGVPANSGTFLHKFWAVSTPEQMQQAQNSAEQSRQHTPAASKRKATTERNQTMTDVTKPAQTEQASSTTSAKKKKSK